MDHFCKNTLEGSSVFAWAFFICLILKPYSFEALTVSPLLIIVLTLPHPQKYYLYLIGREPRILNFLQCVGQTVVLAQMTVVPWLRNTGKRNVGIQDVKWGSVWKVKDCILWTTQNWYHICWLQINNNLF